MGSIFPSSSLKRLIPHWARCHVWALPHSYISRDLTLHQPELSSSQIHPLLSIPSASSPNQAFFVTCHLDDSQALTVPPVSSEPRTLASEGASANSTHMSITWRTC